MCPCESATATLQGKLLERLKEFTLGTETLSCCLAFLFPLCLIILVMKFPIITKKKTCIFRFLFICCDYFGATELWVFTFIFVVFLWILGLRSSGYFLSSCIFRFFFIYCVDFGAKEVAGNCVNLGIRSCGYSLCSLYFFGSFLYIVFNLGLRSCVINFILAF